MCKPCCVNQSATEKRAATGIQRFVRVLHRALALLLLLSVPGLSTLAKINWYLPQSNPGHYLTTATKMKVAHAPTVKTDAVQSLRRLVVSPQPEMAILSEERQETSFSLMLLDGDLLHRPPFRIRSLIPPFQEQS